MSDTATMPSRCAEILRELEHAHHQLTEYLDPVGQPPGRPRSRQSLEVIAGTAIRCRELSTDLANAAGVTPVVLGRYGRKTS